jgi:hypothetical protein
MIAAANPPGEESLKGFEDMPKVPALPEEAERQLHTDSDASRTTTL